MSTAPRRIVTGHDASGRSVVLSDAATPKALDIGTAAFHEIWITAQTPPVQIAATEPEPTERPVLDAAARQRRGSPVHRDGARRRVTHAPHGDGGRRRRARGRDLAAARRRVRDTGGYG